MATRTQKTAKKERAAKATKGKAAGAKAKRASGRQAKPKAKAALEFEEIQVQEPQAETPGFFARLRASREARRQKRAEERAAAEERAREEEAARLAAAEAAEKERLNQEAAEERRRAEEEAARILAEEQQRKADEERRKVEERQAAALARKEQRKAERAALEERERRAAEEAEAEDRRKAEERAARRQAKAEAKREAELEPEMEFEEASKRVDPAHAMVLAGKPATPVDEQAEKVAAELARRRSKPVVIVGEDLPVPKIPKAATQEEESPTLVEGEAVVEEKYRPTPPPPAPTGLSIPEAFLLLANEGGWDERAEKVKSGAFGGALAGALLLELLQRGRLLVQRDRFTVVGDPTGDEPSEAVVDRLRRIQARKANLASLRQMAELAKWDRELLEPFKDRLAGRGLAEHGHRMHLGLFYRSYVTVLDEDAQERLRNKLRRAIAGGGTPEASSILLLGLLDACGLLGSIVPDEAMDYNRKRLNGLLGGRDLMGYKVDAQLKGVQEMAVRTILQNVRTLTN